MSKFLDKLSKIENKIVVSGHRAIDEEKLKPVLTKALEKLYDKGYRTLIQGMAQGTDILAAEIALDIGFIVVCAIPFYGHDAKLDIVKFKRYHSILAHPKSFPVFCTPGVYNKGALFARNQWMVDQAKGEGDLMIAVMSDEKSDTGNAVGKARDAGLKIHIYNPETEKWN